MILFLVISSLYKSKSSMKQLAVPADRILATAD